MHHMCENIYGKHWLTGFIGISLKMRLNTTQPLCANECDLWTKVANVYLKYHVQNNFAFKVYYTVLIRDVMFLFYIIIVNCTPSHFHNFNL